MAEEKMPTTGTPRWVKIVGIIALALLVLVVVVIVTGRHGPRRHAGDPQTPPIDARPLR